MTAPDMSPSARAQRRLEARQRHLEDALDRAPNDEGTWDAYLRVVAILATLRGAQGAPLVTTQELAQQLGVAPSTIRDAVKQGRLQPTTQFGRRAGYRFRAGQRPE